MNPHRVSSLAPAAGGRNMPRHSMGTTGAERRRYARIETLIKAKIYSDYQYLNCQVLDLSENGARIRPNSVVVPRAVSMQIPGVGTVAARVVWRRKGQVGLQFRTGPDGVCQAAASYLNKVASLH